MVYLPQPWCRVPEIRSLMVYLHQPWCRVPEIRSLMMSLPQRWCRVPEIRSQMVYLPQPWCRVPEIRSLMMSLPQPWCRVPEFRSLMVYLPQPWCSSWDQINDDVLTQPWCSIEFLRSDHWWCTYPSPDVVYSSWDEVSDRIIQVLSPCAVIHQVSLFVSCGRHIHQIVCQTTINLLRNCPVYTNTACSWNYIIDDYY